MIRFSIIFLSIVIVASCSPKEQSNSETPQQKEAPIPESTNAQLMEEVMALHDAVMPEMGNIRSTERSLRELAEGASGTEVARYNLQADLLDSAFKGMMGWMRQFDPEYEGTDDEVAAYLTDQKAKMSEVKELMETALEDGQRLLESSK